jgi:hypothetical protein
LAALDAAMGGVLFARRDPPAELSQAQRDVTASLERYQG